MDIKLSNKRMWINGIKGRVHSITNTTYTSGNSTNYNDKFHMNISTQHQQKFWITRDCGQEFEQALNVSVANGHEVIVVYGNLEKKKTGKILYFKNLSSGEEYFFLNNLPYIIKIKNLLKILFNFLIYYMIPIKIIQIILNYFNISQLPLISFLMAVVTTCGSLFFISWFLFSIFFPSYNKKLLPIFKKYVHDVNFINSLN